MGDCGGEPQKDGLPHRSPHRDDEGSHHRLGMAGLEPVQGAEQNCGRNEEPGVGSALLQEFG